MKPKYELLREAYSILGGIPDNKFDLGSVIDKKGKNLSCGTVACAIGWLGMHPKFQALGLKADMVDDIETLTFRGKECWYEEAGANIFGISEADSEKLFKPVNYREDIVGNDKEIFLDRLYRYLESHGQLTHQLKK